MALVLLAIPFLRPNLLGESLSVVGFVLMCAAAALSVLSRGDQDADHRPTVGKRDVEPGAPLVFCLGLGYLWLLVRAAATAPVEARFAIQGFALTVVSVLALVAVCRHPRTRLAVGRGFVILTAGLCASYLVTALLWTVTGIGSGQIGTIFFDQWGAQPVYFPFTPTVSMQAVLGVDIPRFSGLGREPGWMAMYCAIAYFLADMVNMRGKWLKLLLVVGLIGCISTAGFGVFVVTWGYHTFLRDRGEISLTSYFRQIAGLGVIAGALWVAIAAPVLGLSAKSTQNEISLDERRLATEAGVRALFDRPLGGNPTEAQGGINLISDIAVSGLPFVLLVCAALLLPMVRQGPSRFSNAVVVIVFLTMLTSQPPKDSTWAFGLVALAAACRRPDMEFLAAGAPARDRSTPSTSRSGRADGQGAAGVDAGKVSGRTIGGWH